MLRKCCWYWNLFVTKLTVVLGWKWRSFCADGLITYQKQVILTYFTGQKFANNTRNSVWICIFKPAEIHSPWAVCYFMIFSRFYPNRDYVTFGSLLSQIRLSFICNVLAPYSGVESFGNISSPFCTFVQIFTEIVPGEPLFRGVNHKRGIKLERWWTYRRLYLIAMSRSIICN